MSVHSIRKCPKIVGVFLVFALVAVLPQTTNSAEKSLRLGIYSPRCPELGIALTAAFSAKPGIELVEREELSRLVNEQKLAGISSSGVYPGADKLLGAQYLIWIEPREIKAALNTEKSSTLSVTIPSARLIDCKTGGLFSWVEVPQSLDTAQAVEWLSKNVTFQMEKAKNSATQKISLLGLRSESVTSETQLIERELNVALSMNLQSDTRSLVLERWRLNDLIFEKELNSQINSPFWTASILVDGSIATSGKELIVRVRIRRAGEEIGRVVECRGARQEISTLIADITKAILGENKPDSPAIWNAEHEAVFYQKEGVWLMDHRLPRQAAQAMESACALGSLQREREMLRIKAYAMCAFPDEFEPKTGGDGYDGRELREKDIPESISYAIQMSQLMVDYLTHFRNRDDFDRTGPSYQDPGVLGRRCLVTLFHVLRAAHQQGFKIKASAQLRDLRQSTREIIEQIEVAHLHYVRVEFYILLTQYAAYWNEEPAGAIQFYKKVLTSNFDSVLMRSVNWPEYLRQNLSVADQFHPPLLQGSLPENKFPLPFLGTCRVIDWTSTEDDVTPKRQWTEYVKGLLASDNPLERADGWLFSWGALSRQEDRAAAISGIVSFMIAEKAAFTGSYGGSISWDMVEPIRLMASNRTLTKEYAQTVDLCEELLEQSGPLPQTAIYLFSWMIATEEGKDNATEESSHRILEGLNAREKLIPSTEKMYRLMLEGFRDNLLTRFPNLLPQRTENMLSVKRVWTRTRFSPDLKNAYFFELPLWSEGKMWVIQGGLKAIDLDTFKMAPAQPSSIRERIGQGYRARLVLSSKKAYIPTANGVAEFNRELGAWRDLKLPLSSYAVYEANGMIFAPFSHTLKTPDDIPDQGTGLYQIYPEAGAANLVFSTHRRPVQHPLDSIEPQRPFCLFSSTEGGPIIGFQSTKAETSYYNIETGEKWGKFPSLRATKANPTAEGVILWQEEEKILSGVGYINLEGRYELLLWNSNLKKEQKNEPVWKMPQEFTEKPYHYDRGLCTSMSGGDLYILSFTSYNSLQAPAGLTLYYFKRGQAEAVRIPIKIEMPDEDRKILEATPYYLINRTLSPKPQDGDFLATPKGVVILANDGFWFIPSEDISSYINALSKR